MAGMDQEAWFVGFDVVPRAVLLLVSQAPVARHMAGLYHRTWRCPPFASLVSDMLAAPLLEVSFSCRFASLSFVFCVVALFSAVDPVAVEVSRRRSACLPPER